MKYFVVTLPLINKEINQKVRSDHLAYMVALEEKSKIFAKGRFVDGSGGMVIYRAETIEEAEELAINDPYVIHGARSCDIREWFIVEKGREYE
ncbi:YciI family protein [Paenibacillus cymbidii]|uniref:YciI family protein n=1 Tax=Paenibacillus cymbidii TaxID=1639034 RepID=UPI001082301D|nr:YciI family protein [Paenibacillus cymbidii]